MGCKMNQSKQLTDGALLTAVFIGILLVSMFIPILAMVSIFLLPIPFILYTSRHDWKPALLMLTAALLITILLTTIYTLPLTIVAGLGGILIGSAIYRKLTAYETWARGTFGFIIGLLFAFVFTQFVFDVNILQQFKQMTTESMEMSSGVIEQFATDEQTEELKATMEETMNSLVDLFPFFLAASAILFAFVSQWVSYKVINRLDRKNLHFPPFRDLRFPVAIIFVYVIALLFAYIFTDPDSMLYMATQNLLVITQMLVTIQGFSFLFFYTHHKNMTKAFPIICTILALFIPILLFIVRFIGIIDLGFELRDRLAKKK